MKLVISNSYKILILFGILIIPLLFSSLISSLLINTFNNSLTAENLTFTGNQNITRYLEIPRYANVTSAYLNLSGLGATVNKTAKTPDDVNIGCYPTYECSGWGEHTDYVFLGQVIIPMRDIVLLNVSFINWTTANQPDRVYVYQINETDESRVIHLTNSTVTLREEGLATAFFEYPLIKEKKYLLAVGKEGLKYSGGQNSSKKYEYPIIDGYIIWNSSAHTGGSIITYTEIWNEIYSIGYNVTQFPINPFLEIGAFDNSPEWGVGNAELQGKNVLLDNLNDTSTEKNFTFNEGGGNYTVYLKIPKQANVISAYLNLSGDGYFDNESTPDNYSGWTEHHDYDAHFGMAFTTGDINITLERVTIYTVSGDCGCTPNIMMIFKIKNSTHATYLYNKTFSGSCRPYTSTTVKNIGYNLEKNSTYAIVIGNYNSCYNGAQNTSTKSYPIPFSSSTFLEWNSSLYIDCSGAPYCQGDRRYYTLNGWADIINIEYSVEGSNYKPNNPYLEVGAPDGIHEWNFTGEFNITHSPTTTPDFSDSLNTNLTGCMEDPNGYCTVPLLFHSDTRGILRVSNIQVNYTNISRTPDFSDSLNLALYNGACDCNGCILNTTTGNCSIPFLFHSDTAGKLEYSAIDINYDPIPFVYLISPVNNSWSSSTKTFVCNATDGVGLANATLYIWNSTGIYNATETNIITGTSNSTTFTITFDKDGVYTWNCLVYNNASYSNWHETNYTLNVDINNPIIILNSPTDGSWLNYKNNIYFNYTPSHSTQTVETCILYGNWSGGWHANLTDSSITEDVVNYFVQNLTDGSYEWTVWCNASETGNSAYSQSGNYTLGIDTIYPTVNITSISTTTGSQTIKFNSTAQDINLKSCKYSIFNSSGGIDGINENVSFTCNQETSATVTGFGTFNLTVYAVDLAGNENSTTKQFTTSQISPGGGGGISEKLEYPVVMLVQPPNVTKLRELQRSILYATINNYCGEKIKGTLAVINYYKRCSLDLGDLEKIKTKLRDYGILLDTNELLIWYQYYKQNRISQFYTSRANIEKYGLVEAIIENPLSLFPNRVDKIFIARPVLRYSILANKKLKSCEVISDTPQMSCHIEKNTTAVVEYNITKFDFLSKIFTGKIAITSYGKTTKEEETRYVDVIMRVYWLGFPVLGIIPIWLLFIIFPIAISIFFVLIIKKKKYKNLKKLIKWRKNV